jgi:acetyltransferase-like isoleucine patch superfamily enzyme
MRVSEASVTADYVEVEYRQFSRSTRLHRGMRLTGYLLWPLIVPLALAAAASNTIFRTLSELLALVPYLFGVVVRYEFYRWTLRRCGSNVVIGFGTVFLYRDIQIGDHVLIGMYSTVHHCDFGSYVVAAEGCRFLSGARYHNFDRTDVPMALQGGRLRRVRIGDDCWIGANAIVMADVAAGSVVGAGAVVVAPVEPFTIVAGNPARVVRKRR